MSTKKILPQLCSAATLAMLVCAPLVLAQSTSGSTTTTQSSTTTTAPATTLSKSDQRMLQDMAYANQSEIAAAKLALTKSQNDNVKTFAQKMVDDHTLAMQDLQQIAQKHNVTLPTQPDSKHQAMMTRLEKLSGTAFDQRYMAQGGLADHQAIHKLLQRVQNRAQDPELKAAASKTLTVVNQHLASAQQLKRSGTSTGSSGSTGSGASGGAKNMPSGSAGSSGATGGTSTPGTGGY